MKLSPGLLVADRFRLVRELGEGGMGSVWLAHHEKIEMPCAVKFIHADVADAAGVRERFEREAKVAGQLKSPHVVQVLDYGVSGDMPYIAMEFLEGEDLAKRLDARGRLSPEESITIVAQIARALTKAHAAGLVHRDLKPENVFLVKDDDHEIVKVLDFGIAKANTPIETRTKTGALMGTPRYMSPEQAQGQKNLDHRSDLWSLGVIGYRCVVGALPFDSDAIGDLMMRIIVHPLPIPSQILPGLPPSFDAWWLRAAARDPAHRFQSAKELADALATSFGYGVAQGATAGATPMHGDSGGFSRSPSAPSNPAINAGRAYTPASSQPLPTAMIGAPTMMPDGRSRESGQPAQFTPSSNYPPPSSTPQAYAPQAFAGQQVVPQTLGPASRTFNAPLKKKSSALPIVVAIVALAAGASGAAFGIHAMSASTPKADASARPTGAATQPAPPSAEAPRVEVAPAPTPAEPTASPPSSSDADTEQEAPPRAQTQKPSTHPKPGKIAPVPPAPARSGKVRIKP